jgi:hypothetical protein
VALLHPPPVGPTPRPSAPSLPLPSQLLGLRIDGRGTRTDGRELDIRLRPRPPEGIRPCGLGAPPRRCRPFPPSPRQREASGKKVGRPSRPRRAAARGRELDPPQFNPDARRRARGATEEALARVEASPVQILGQRPKRPRRGASLRRRARGSRRQPCRAARSRSLEILEA